jgi:hypothetical protein
MSVSLNDPSVPETHRARVSLTVSPKGGLDNATFDLACECGADFGRGRGRTTFAEANRRLKAHLGEHGAPVPSDPLADVAEDELDGLGEALLTLVRSAAKNQERRRAERGEAASPAAPLPPRELSPAQKARARAAHARRLAAENREATSW